MGKALVEVFDALDEYIASSNCSIHERKPLFTDDYDQQEGRMDAIGARLCKYLRSRLEYHFGSLAGQGLVDVVTLAETGQRGYSFVIRKRTDHFMRQVGKDNFYYDLPGVLGVLEGFIALTPEMDDVIWIEKAEGIFLFVVQQRGPEA